MPARRSSDRVAPLRVAPAAVLAVVVRPRLWSSALRVVLRLAEPGWWRHWPPRPVPASAYARFRHQAMLGDSDRPLGPDELVGYLKWCERMGQLR